MHAYVEAMRGHATLLDTRKTIPGLRVLEKYATRIGGATNYRMDYVSVGRLMQSAPAAHIGLDFELV